MYWDEQNIQLGLAVDDRRPFSVIRQIGYISVLLYPIISSNEETGSR